MGVHDAPVHVVLVQYSSTVVRPSDTLHRYVLKEKEKCSRTLMWNAYAMTIVVEKDNVLVQYVLKMRELSILSPPLNCEVQAG